MIDEAAANLQKPEGVKYQKEVEQSLSKWMQQCAQDDPDRTKFEFMLQVAADGGAPGCMDAAPHSRWQLSAKAHLRRAREERDPICDATASSLLAETRTGSGDLGSGQIIPAHSDRVESPCTLDAVFN